MARVQKFKNILTETLLPDKAPAGTVYWCSDSQTLWLATASEEVLNLSDILEGKHVGARQRGVKGEKGDPSTVAGPKGERGERGAAGHDGVCKCRTGIQGLKGDKGDNVKGDKGDRGDITIVGDAELLAAVSALKAKHVHFLAALSVQFERNAGRQHSGLQKTIDNVLQSLKRDAGL